MIRPYDKVKNATYNVEELGEYFRSIIDYKEQDRRIAVAKAEAFKEGYTEAVHCIASIMGASNYRANNKENVYKVALEKLVKQCHTTSDSMGKTGKRLFGSDDFMLVFDEVLELIGGEGNG